MSLSVKLKYSQRLFIWLLGYSILLVGCFVGFQYHREKEFKAAEFNARLQLINAHILDDLAHGDDVRDVVKSQLHPFEDLRVSIIDMSGKVIYDNTPDVSATSNHLSREEIREAMANGSGYSVRRHSETTGNTYFYSATMGDDGLIVRTAVPYSVSLSGLLHADLGFMWVMGVVTLVMCVLGYFATRRLGRHIQRLRAFAGLAERGVSVYDTAPFPNDELGAISNHIIRLYANLQQAISDRDREHEAVLYQQREAQRIKKQLTDNINHELKTPVASMRVCLEILLNNDNLDERKRDGFIRRCYDNTERLTRLLQDVSIVNRLDEAPSSIARELVNLTDVINDVSYEHEALAATKGMRIVNRVHAAMFVDGNVGLLESVFRNLIANAVAYSGGTCVTISADDVADGKFTVCVEDDGTGVPAGHLPHLFERFYRIDKGRSRSAGGTGLGLSIVKNAVQFHGGSITVSNRPTRGLRFIIVFPAAGS